jgi:protein-tyrosine phosphatase
MRLLFVCLGNICRSPLAEGIMLHLKEKNNLNIEIDSAGTANYHVGEKPDERTIANAFEHGINLNPLRARQFVKEDFKNFDLILCMDNANKKNVLSLTNIENEKLNVHLFLEYTHDDNLIEVPDPYYGSNQDFENVFQLVYKNCEQLMKKLN